MEKEYDFYAGHTLLMNDAFFMLTTDSVLLSDFVRVSRGARGIDLGAGCGCLGLLVMLRNPGVFADGIEIVPQAAALAAKNYARCGFADEKIFAEDFCTRKWSEKYDFAVSNPPYFSAGNGKKSGSAAIDKARRGDISEVCAAAYAATSEKGRFFLCQKAERLTSAFKALLCAGLEPKRLRFVHETEDSAASLVLIEAAKGGEGMKTEKPLFLRRNGVFTEEYNRIYGR